MIPKRVLLDIDGVCYLRGLPISGAAAGVKMIRDLGARVAFVTNNSAETVSTYASMLDAAGIAADPAEIVTSSVAAAELVRGTDLPVLVMGGPGIDEALVSAGLEPVHPEGVGDRLDQEFAAAVVGIDRNLTYERLDLVSRIVRGGARFVATNLDSTYPTEAGVAPGAGAIVAAVSTASGATPEVAGKPESGMAIAARAVVGEGDALMIGDRLDTDVKFASLRGFDSALVLTGISTVADLVTSDHVPHYVAGSLPELLEDPVEIRRNGDRYSVGSGGDRDLARDVAEALATRGP